MSSLVFYREQADLQTIAADAASLPQVRDRCLRAVSAWTELADRAQKTEDARRAKALDTGAKATASALVGH
jgi:hypothetical protein